MRAFIYLTNREIYRFMVVWVQTIAAPVVTAVLYQFIFGNLSTLLVGNSIVDYTKFLIPGLIMMQVMMNAIANGSSSLIQSKYTGHIIFILMAPISPGIIYLSYLLGSIVRSLAVGLAVFLSICWFGVSMPQHTWAIFLFLFFGVTITGSIGIIMGIVCYRFEELSGFQSFLITPLIYLAGVFFNPEHLSGVWHTLAYMNPFLYIIDGFRYGFIGYKVTNINFGIILLGAVSIMVNYLGYRLTKNGIRMKH